MSLDDHIKQFTKKYPDSEPYQKLAAQYVESMNGGDTK